MKGAASVDISLFQLPAETQLFEAAVSLPDDVGENENEIYVTIQRFSAVYEPIKNFFETVIVNDDNTEIRKNRLNLLSLICNKICNIADLRKIEKSVLKFCRNLSEREGDVGGGIHK